MTFSTCPPLPEHTPLCAGSLGWGRDRLLSPWAPQCQKRFVGKGERRGAGQSSHFSGSHAIYFAALQAAVLSENAEEWNEGEIRSRHHVLPKVMKLARAMPKSLSMCISAEPQILGRRGWKCEAVQLKQTFRVWSGVVERGLWSILGSELNAYQNQPGGWIFV